QDYSNWGSTVDSYAVGSYRFEPVSARLLLGAQYSRRRFRGLAGQAPNDPALGTDPTASPLPLWDLRDPATWNREAGLPLSPATLTEAPGENYATWRDSALY